MEALSVLCGVQLVEDMINCVNYLSELEDSPSESRLAFLDDSQPPLKWHGLCSQCQATRSYRDLGCDTIRRGESVLFISMHCSASIRITCAPP